MYNIADLFHESDKDIQVYKYDIYMFLCSFGSARPPYLITFFDFFSHYVPFSFHFTYLCVFCLCKTSKLTCNCMYFENYMFDKYL